MKNRVYISQFNQYRINLVTKPYQVESLQGQPTIHFVSPDTSDKPKLYVVKSRDTILYVGITSQSMSARLRNGLKATGKHGYFGYKWKKLTKVDLLVWCFPKRESKPLRLVEAIEGELVYLIRNRTGNWPTRQMEIHFHKPTAKSLMHAEAIYKSILG